LIKDTKFKNASLKNIIKKTSSSLFNNTAQI